MFRTAFTTFAPHRRVAFINSSLRLYSRGSSDVTEHASPENVEKFKSLIKNVRVAMLCTKSGDEIHSRPMYTQTVPFDGESLYFFTGKDSWKIDEIEQDRNCNVSYSDPKAESYVSVVGKTYLIDDKETLKKHWDSSLKAFFPKGIEDENTALIKVQVDGAEVWDSTSSKLVKLIGVAKATITSKPYKPSPDENIKIKF
ncbi:hypothetical protein AKO1_006709 [Acrasis kona]|uniref:Pyridoxamine 5'-phosphate oxidase family protein n=1 Tax=Acrasis kona TaxID=1008807 RepID=A0AAW2ZMK0_9EUKA